MPRGTEVPITPEVLRWAIDESGFSDQQIADSVGVPVEVLGQWSSGYAKPPLTRFRKLAGKLHRQLATFFLPAAPQPLEIQVAFRNISGRPSRPLSPKERRYLRRARRQQEMLGWLSGELNDIPNVARYALSDNPEAAGEAVRESLGVTADEQQRWLSASQAFDRWRSAVEHLGVNVFLYMLGEESCNGFSLWDDRAPLIAISSAWREEARIFTLFHELGHLVRRDNSACIERRTTTRLRDPTERWCEQFAAAVLLPRVVVERSLPKDSLRGNIRNLAVASAFATRARVSLRAATIRLIELGLADWDLYDQIPPAADAKSGGGGGTGRNRLAIKEDEFGGRGTSLFVEAVRKEILSRSQAVDYLDIPDVAFDHLTLSAQRP